MKLTSIRVLGFCFLFTGCAYFSKTTTDNPIPVSVYPAPDPEMAQLLDMYRDSLNQVMSLKIAIVKDTLRFEKPEGSLTNLVADALRFRAASELREFVHVGIIGEESFRIYFEPGDLTLGDVYEFIPSNNHLVVLTLNGETLMEIIEQVAVQGGAPISGVRFRIDESGKPTGILVNAEVIDLHKKYLVATSSRMSNGRGPFPALGDADERTDIDLSIQDLYADYFKNQVELFAFKDGRIRQ